MNGIERNTSLDLSTKNMHICTALKALNTEKICIMGETLYLNYILDRCLPYFSSKQPLKYAVTEDVSSHVMQSWFVRKEFPYVENLSRHILLLIEHGFLKKWLSSIRKDDKVCKIRRNSLKKYSVIKLENIVAFFYVWIFGIILSIICFISELIHYKYKSRKK